MAKYQVFSHSSMARSIFPRMPVTILLNSGAIPAGRADATAAMAEQTTRAEPDPDCLKVLHRVEGAGAIPGRVKQVAHDHVILAVRGINEAASVCHEDLEALSTQEISGTSSTPSA